MLQESYRWPTLSGTFTSWWEPSSITKQSIRTSSISNHKHLYNRDDHMNRDDLNLPYSDGSERDYLYLILFLKTLCLVKILTKK